MKCKGDCEVACMRYAVMCLLLIGRTAGPRLLLPTIGAKRTMRCSRIAVGEGGRDRRRRR
jgi:hypothetical protein